MAVWLRRVIVVVNVVVKNVGTQRGERNRLWWCSFVMLCCAGVPLCSAVVVQILNPRCESEMWPEERFKGRK